MIAEVGHFSLVLGFALALVQAIVPLYGAWRGRAALMAVGRGAARGQLLFVLLSYACLHLLFIANDFSVRLVADNSHSRTPLIYRITAVWGNHEGSMLLWIVSLSLWTMAVTRWSRGLPEAFTARVLGVLGAVGAGFTAFTLLTSNPFARLLPAAREGRDLNPLLQDPGMIIHPPLLYLGYVGFSIAFAFAIAALMTGRLDAAWARWSRPWTVAAWVLLTAGIAVGSSWAYYELGWGGWWFWDPVENASFMPWLLGTALIHSLAVTEKRGAFRGWTVLLAIGTFSLSLLGTFLVRSGVVTSVHAFATDPARGLFILCLLVTVVGASLLLYAWRAPRLQGGGHFQLVSRDAALLANNALLSVACAAVLLGTLYPLLLDALGLGKISVGPPYFDTTFVPLMTPVLVLLVPGAVARWKTDTWQRLARRLGPAALASALLGPALGYGLGHFTWRACLGLALAAWIVLGSLQLLAERLHGGGRADIATRLRGIPGSWWGMWLAHLGLGVFIIGVTMVNSFQSQLDVRMLPGQTAHLAGYTFTFGGVEQVAGPNWIAARATLDVARGGRHVATLRPETRHYVTQAMPMTQSAIDVGPLRDLYTALGESLPDGGWIVNLFHKPFISWIWAGCALMILGGLAAAADRRYRKPASRRDASPPGHGRPPQSEQP